MRDVPDGGRWSSQTRRGWRRAQASSQQQQRMRLATGPTRSACVLRMRTRRTTSMRPSRATFACARAGPTRSACDLRMRPSHAHAAFVWRHSHALPSRARGPPRRLAALLGAARLHSKACASATRAREEALPHAGRHRDGTRFFLIVYLVIIAVSSTNAWHRSRRDASRRHWYASYCGYAGSGRYASRGGDHKHATFACDLRMRTR